MFDTTYRQVEYSFSEHRLYCVKLESIPASLDRISIARVGLTYCALVLFQLARRRQKSGESSSRASGRQGQAIGLIGGVIGAVWAFLGRWMKGKFANMLDTFLSWLLSCHAGSLASFISHSEPAFAFRLSWP